MAKGFSVVAGEVRMLAHRSADAAKNIKQLIAQTHQNVQQGAAIVREAEKIYMILSVVPVN